MNIEYDRVNFNTSTTALSPQTLNILDKGIYDAVERINSITTEVVDINRVLQEIQTVEEIVLFQSSDEIGGKENITLSESCNNYKQIIITFQGNGVIQNNFVIENANNKNIELVALKTFQSTINNIVLSTKEMIFNDNILNVVSYCRYFYDSKSLSNDNDIGILKVVGRGKRTA